MRKLVWFTVGFSGACAIGAYFYNPRLLNFAVISFLFAGIFFLLVRWKRNFRVACAVCLGISIGLSAFGIYDRTILQDVRQRNGRTEFVKIQATDYCYPTDRGCAFDGEVVLDGRNYKVRTYLDTMQPIKPGDRIEGNFRLRMTFWNGNDSLNNAGKGTLLFAYQTDDSEIITSEETKWENYPAIWRNSLKAMINNVFSEDTAGFAKALLLGDNTGIDYETDSALRVSGIRHVIAVSGLHISIVFGFVYLLAAKRRVLTALIGIPAVVLFAALAGFTPSVTRACIMQILMMLALLFKKDYDPPTSLAFAVLVMLGINPMTIASVSFQLSVSCIIGIFVFTERIYVWLMQLPFIGKRARKLYAFACGSISVSLGSMITVTPLVAYYFGTVSLIGIVTNLVVLWAITAIFYGIMFSCALGYIFMPLAQLVGSIFGWLIRYVESATDVLSRVPMAAVYTKSVYIVIWLMLAYALLAVYLLIKKKPLVLILSLLVCSLCLAVGFSWIEPLISECRVTMLDVGQGQAILLQSAGKTFLVDCGGDYDEGASDMTAETLLSQGIDNLDGIIITHYDRDHAGGLPYLLTRITAENLFLPHAKDGDGTEAELRKLSDATVHSVYEDTEICFANAKITIFAPVSYNSGNESSMCVLFQTENCDILIVGDRSEKTERILVSRYDLPELDVLVAGHHGSKTSTSMELLEETKPEYAFISVGEDNPYGHPAQQTIDRFLEFGCKIFRTDQCGTVIFRR